ncbi:AzlD domain-containing protein [Enterococcus sp. 669A]|uniref:AzlD domain-containing protein n=1 Tax=Candidatus Enterococcus moelleringii TaxID=2815325 RepID=A0ABS3L9K2_9ENTE|nr:AzlD domain-containing protein [Enterococcus sp. 669A]MBO1306295.1 AzlD domain-containing protein [Enterococcus sp. 669A]
MSLIQQALTISMVVLGTLITRGLSFFMFPANRKTPEIIIQVGELLPAAILGMLVIYSLRNVNVADLTELLPTILAAAIVVVVHTVKRNMMLSVFSGTFVYIVLVNFVLV